MGFLPKGKLITSFKSEDFLISSKDMVNACILLFSSLNLDVLCCMSTGVINNNSSYIGEC